MQPSNFQVAKCLFKCNSLNMSLKSSTFFFRNTNELQDIAIFMKYYDNIYKVFTLINKAFSFILFTTTVYCYVELGLLIIFFKMLENISMISEWEISVLKIWTVLCLVDVVLAICFVKAVGNVVGL